MTVWRLKALLHLLSRIFCEYWTYTVCIYEGVSVSMCMYMYELAHTRGHAQYTHMERFCNTGVYVAAGSHSGQDWRESCGFPADFRYDRVYACTYKAARQLHSPKNLCLQRIFPWRVLWALDLFPVCYERFTCFLTWCFATLRVQLFARTCLPSAMVETSPVRRSCCKSRLVAQKPTYWELFCNNINFVVRNCKLLVKSVKLLIERKINSKMN